MSQIDDLIASLTAHSTSDFSRLYKADTGKVQEDYQQKEDGWCGPASLSYAMHQMGVDVPQEKLVKDTKTSIQKGVDPKDLVDEARRFGFSTSTVFGQDPNTSLEKLNQAVTDGNSVIVDWLDGDSLKNDGHYSVFLGSTGNKVIIWDPSGGKERAIDKSNFVSHWKDTTIGGKLFKHWALILQK